MLFQLMHASSFKGNRSSIISMIWFRFWYLFAHFRCTFAENAHNSWRSFGSFRASFFFSIFSIRACERSKAEPVRCVVEAGPQARPEDHLRGIFCSSFVAEYHLGLTSALQHCQHNGAFRFLAAQVFIDFGFFSGPYFGSFLGTGLESSIFVRILRQVPDL